MSPRIFAVPASDPSQSPVGFDVEGGWTSAMGFPNRVTRIGVRVFRTRSSTSRHVALNLEMAISCMANLVEKLTRTMVQDDGQLSVEEVQLGLTQRRTDPTTQ